jgi:hypothetical protein
MIANSRNLSSGRWVLPLVLAAQLQGVSGCSLMPAGEGAASRQWSDETAQGMRAGSADSAAAAAPAKTEPFWEKYRDKRVNQINQHLNVEEPAGW